MSLGGNLLDGPAPAFLTRLANLEMLFLNDNPGLDCWEDQASLDWALNSLQVYEGPYQAAGEQ